MRWLCGLFSAWIDWFEYIQCQGFDNTSIVAAKAKNGRDKPTFYEVKIECHRKELMLKILFWESAFMPNRMVRSSKTTSKTNKSRANIWSSFHLNWLLSTLAYARTHAWIHTDYESDRNGLNSMSRTVISTKFRQI